MAVSLKGVTVYIRPKSQGGLWYLAEKMKIERVLDAQ